MKTRWQWTFASAALDFQALTMQVEPTSEDGARSSHRESVSVWGMLLGLHRLVIALRFLQSFNAHPRLAEVTRANWVPSNR